MGEIRLEMKICGPEHAGWVDLSNCRSPTDIDNKSEDRSLGETNICSVIKTIGNFPGRSDPLPFKVFCASLKHLCCSSELLVLPVCLSWGIVPESRGNAILFLHPQSLVQGLVQRNALINIY